MNYLLRNYDSGSKYGGKTEKEKIEVDQWTSFLISTLGPMLGQCNWFKHYHSSKNDDAYARYQAQAYRCFGVLEGQLKSHGKDWVIRGDSPSVVDFHFEPWMRQHSFAGLSLDEYPKVKAWLDRAQALPEVKKAYEKVKAGEEA